MKTLCLTGWQQRHDALAEIAQEALHLDYSAHGSVQAVRDLLEPHGQEFETVIGWSLGGMIALDLIESHTLSCQHLVLISVAWQMVQSKDVSDATPPEILDETIRNYQSDPNKTLAAFMPLIVMNDSDQKELTRNYIRDLPPLWEAGLKWLKYLKEFSCAKKNLSLLPRRITLIHGDADVITPVTQLGYFREALPKADIYVMEGCAHAPHWHDVDAVRKLII